MIIWLKIEMKEFFRTQLIRVLFHTSILWPDKTYLKINYFLRTGNKLNLDNPRSFNEKLEWMKLYDRNPEYVVMADKVKAKDWVAERIGKEYIIPTLGVWERAGDIDFDSLPDRFVIKCNHNSGTGMYICKDKSEMDEAKVRKDLAKGLKENYFLSAREWPYKDIPRRIIAEEFLEDSSHNGDLADYKFYCFDGEPQYCQVIRDRSTKETIDIYDKEWNLMPFVGLNPDVNNGLTPVEKPEQLSLMLDICRKLAINMPFSRIDLYSVNGHCYFGEVTFFPMSGKGSFHPTEWNERIGDMIHLDRIQLSNR